MTNDDIVVNLDNLYVTVEMLEYPPRNDGTRLWFRNRFIHRDTRTGAVLRDYVAESGVALIIGD